MAPAKSAAKKRAPARKSLPAEGGLLVFVELQGKDMAAIADFIDQNGTFWVAMAKTFPFPGPRKPKKPRSAKRKA